jgi:hypothetical protein
MSDRELLEDAAKAEGTVFQDASIQCVHRGGPVFLRPEHGVNYQWDPLIDNANAFELAVKLRLVIQHAPKYVVVMDVSREVAEHQDTRENGGDPYAATRRAIVRAAAAIGRALRSEDQGSSPRG